jgi:hypothetical protein
MLINNQFELGSTVYLKTDMEQHPRQIVAIRVDVSKCLMYLLVSGVETSWHYEIEILTDKDYKML